MITNTTVEFANAIATLIRNEDVAPRLTANARRKVVERYSMRACQTAVQAVLP